MAIHALNVLQARNIYVKLNNSVLVNIHATNSTILIAIFPHIIFFPNILQGIAAIAHKFESNVAIKVEVTPEEYCTGKDHISPLPPQQKPIIPKINGIIAKP